MSLVRVVKSDGCQYYIEQQYSSWRPIEDAPKDGTKLLLYGLWAGEINGPNKDPAILVGKYDDGHTDYPGYEWIVEGTDAYAAWMNPTHWMSLPEYPPK